MPIFKRSRRNPLSTPLLLFDFDGTLADTVETGLSVFNEIAGEYGLRKIRHAEIAELRKLNTRAMLDRLGISRLLAVKIAARMRSMFNGRIDEVDLLPGVGDMIRGLREHGYSLAILSSNSAKNIRKFLRHNELIECFEFIEGGASLFGKAERLRRILKKEKLKPEHVMYVGDETRDMEAARGAGVRAAAACWGVNEEEAMSAEDPEFVLSTARDLLAAADFARSHKPKPREHGIRVSGDGEVK